MAQCLQLVCHVSSSYATTSIAAVVVAAEQPYKLAKQSKKTAKKKDQDFSQTDFARLWIVMNQKKAHGIYAHMLTFEC